MRTSRLFRPVRWQAWSILLAVALAFTALAANHVYVPGDVTVARLVQTAHGFDLVSPVSEGLYRFGLYPVYPLAGLLAAGLASWRGRHVTAAFVLLAMLTRPLGTVVKVIVERPRPSEGLVPFVEGASGFSFPSGHVFGTVLLVGFVWYALVEHQQDARRRALTTVAALSFVALMGLQRVYAGAHWPSDVLAAYLWGGLVLFVLIQLYRGAGWWWGNLRPATSAVA